MILDLDTDQTFILLNMDRGLDPDHAFFAQYESGMISISDFSMKKI
jgi:hypothetical protein